VFTDFSLIVNAGSISQNSAHLNAAFLGQLVRGQVNILGWLALYAVLITLLFQAEQLEGRKPNRAKLNPIILGKVILWVTVLISVAVYQSGMHLLRIIWLAAPLNLLGMFGWRTFIRWRRAHAHARGRGVRRALIIGAGALGREVAAALESDDGRKVVGFLNNEQLGGTVLGRVSDLSRIARAEFIDEIIVACVGKSELKRRLIREARRQHLAVSIVPDYLDCESRNPEFECLSGLPLLTLHEDRRLLALYSKRMVDVVLSSLGLLITAPLIALIALAIKLDSRGPAFYRAPRAGRKGRSFACCKPFLQAVANGMTINMLALIALDSFRRQRLRGVLAMSFFFAVPIAVLATKTRAVWLAFAGSVIVMMFFSNKRVRYACLGLIVAASLALCSAITFGSPSNSIADRFEEQSPVEFRIAMYRAGWEMFLEKPVFGWGIRDMQAELASRVDDFHQEEFFLHNTYLEILVQHGLLGIGLYAWIVIDLLRLARHAGSTSLHGQFLDRGFQSIWVVLVLVYLVNASFVVMNYQFVNGLLFTVAGMLAARKRQLQAQLIPVRSAY